MSTYSPLLLSVLCSQLTSKWTATNEIKFSTRVSYWEGKWRNRVWVIHYNNNNICMMLPVQTRSKIQINHTQSKCSWLFSQIPKCLQEPLRTTTQHTNRGNIVRRVKQKQKNKSGLVTHENVHVGSMLHHMTQTPVGCVTGVTAVKKTTTRIQMWLLETNLSVIPHMSICRRL